MSTDKCVCVPVMSQWEWHCGGDGANPELRLWTNIVRLTRIGFWL